jgi:hypothetical protein
MTIDKMVGPAAIGAIDCNIVTTNDSLNQFF